MSGRGTVGIFLGTVCLFSRWNDVTDVSSLTQSQAGEELIQAFHGCGYAGLGGVCELQDVRSARVRMLHSALTQYGCLLYEYALHIT